MQEKDRTESAADRFGSRGTALVVVLFPLAAVAALLIPEPHFQTGYRHFLRIYLAWLPAILMVWVFSLLRLFWPERVPLPLDHDAPRTRRLVQIKRGAWIAGVVFLIGSFVVAGGDHEWLLNDFGMVTFVCVAAAISVSAYIRVRTKGLY